MSQLSPAAEPFSNLAGSQADSGPDWVAGPWKEGTADGAALHLNAQYQAEIASKCATELAAYFQSLWGTVIHLQHKVQELEDWKKKALEDVRKLRDEHKTLRRKVMGDEPVEHVRSNVRAKTMPPQLVPMVVLHSKSFCRADSEKDKWSPRITCFGEAMLRYVPDPHGGEDSPFAAKWLRSVGGAELNITVALSRLGWGGRSRWVSVVPQGVLGDDFLHILGKAYPDEKGSGNLDLVRREAGDVGIYHVWPAQHKIWLVPMVTDSPPPGLQLSPKNDSPPGLKVPQKEVSFAKQGSLSSGHSSTLTMASVLSDDPGHLDGVQLSNASVDGLDLERAEWRIGQLSQKLRGCMGRALVSSPFTAAGLEDLRLMVFPEGKELTKGPRSKRQRELYAKKVNEGPLDGCLKIKVPSCPSETELQYFLKVGTSRKGPFRHNFAENTVSGCDDFGVDWLKQLEADGSLLVCVEFVKEAK